MTRTQCCRENIRKIGPICNLSEDEITRIEKVSTFCKDHREISPLATDAVKALMAEPDEEIREKAISSIGKSLESKKNPQTGKFTKKRPDKKDVKTVIKGAKLEKQREELVKKGERIKDLPDGLKVYSGNFLTDYKIIPADSVDCIITDPPYVKEWLDNYGAFAEAAKYVLKPGGFLITYIGHIHMDKILSQMTPHLEYFWIACLKHAGTAKAVHSRHVQCGMKPILIFYKPPKEDPKRYFNDVIQGSGREKSAHEWQQGEDELRQIFEPFTDPGDTILDPFMGSGTTLAWANKNGRRAIGFDINPDNVEIVKGRLCVNV